LHQHQDGEFPVADHPVVAYPWVEARDYPDIRRIMIDGDGWPQDYERWKVEAESAIARLSTEGVELVKARLDPEAFTDWCRANDCPADSVARLAFAAFVAFGED
jgi:hypothetical protein